MVMQSGGFQVFQSQTEMYIIEPPYTAHNKQCHIREYGLVPPFSSDHKVSSYDFKNI